jgi:hypothetical protein
MKEAANRGGLPYYSHEIIRTDLVYLAKSLPGHWPGTIFNAPNDEMQAYPPHVVEPSRRPLSLRRRSIQPHIIQS